MGNPVEVLKKYWGYEAFRPLQEDIIQSVLEGRDTLALLPTGGGKSICYQVPGLMLEGVTIVVTPLVALMRDQVQQLKDRNIRAVAIHSGLSRKDIDRELDNCVYGHYKFLYLSPERLQTDLAMARIRDMKVSQLVVDEAHCISQWGFDFRPSYLKIAEIKELIPETGTLALTATATSQVRKDILESLEMKDVEVFLKSFKRENISFFVLDEENRLQRLYYFIKRIPDTKIIYVRNRRKTREICVKLQQAGISASYYHAGLAAKERLKVEGDFMKGKREVIVSTNAFGMGIDKSDVRAVFHLDLPSGLEEYYQEAGRAGRDGKESYAILFCRDKERELLEANVKKTFPKLEVITRVYKALCIYFEIIPGGGLGESYDFDIKKFSSRFDFSLLEVFHSLKQIEAAGWIHLSDSIYHPPRLMVVVNSEVLYDYRLKNVSLDLIINTILRSYEGLFSVHVPVNIPAIATKLNTSTEKIHSALQLMHKEKIFSYQQASDQPKITFTLPRTQSRNFSIDVEMYKFLQERANDRMKGMLLYTDTQSCRMKVMLEYFDEKVNEDCGKCDICRGMHIETVTESEFAELKSHFLKVVERTPQSVEHVLSTVSFIKRKRAIETLRLMEAEGWITLKNGMLKLEK
nr:RecQ family ATP-dependent DNA helicase [Saprospiraceae bacterium]